MPQSPERPRFSVVIPAHNEEDRIATTLTDFAEHFYDSEIIVVLNGCTDQTETLVSAAQQRFPQIRVLDIRDAVGKGGAVRAGFLVATAPWIGFVDADGATSASEMRRLFEAVNADDGVIGSRWCRGAIVDRRQPFRRRLASRCFNVLVRLLFGLRYSDTQCGAKVFRAEALRQVADHVDTANFAFDVDLLVMMRALGFYVREVPSAWRDIDGSRVRLMPASARMFAALVRLRFRRSFLNVILPLFDRMFPTRPVPIRNGFRILILNWRDPEHPKAGGAEIYLFEMAKRWTKAGHYVEWLTAGFPGASKTAQLSGISITRVGGAVSVYALLPFIYLSRFHDRFDMIVDAENGIPFFSPMYSMKPKLCLVFHVHREVFRKHLPWPISELFVWLEGRFMPFVYRNSRFVTISDTSREEMVRSKFSKRHIPVVRSGVDASLAPGPKASLPTFAYLGRLRAYKRIHLLIAAFARVLKSAPDARLEILGDGDERQKLEQLCIQLGISRSVTFEGFVSEERKREALQRAWAFVSPSEIEGWGIAAIEANACGTPAIAFRVPGLREAIVHGVSGVLVDEHADLSGAMLRIIKDDAWREALEHGALAHARAFSWDTTAQKMLGIITSTVIGEHPSLLRVGSAWMVAKRSLPLDDAMEMAEIVLEPVYLEA